MDDDTLHTVLVTDVFSQMLVKGARDDFVQGLTFNEDRFKPFCYLDINTEIWKFRRKATCRHPPS